MKTKKYRFVISMAAITVLTSMTATAHAVLTDSTPKANATLSAGHASLVFKYNSKVDHDRSRLTLIAADKSEKVLTIDAGAASNELDSATDLTPGSYIVHWQALSPDGHVTHGDVPFRVAAKP